MVNSNNQGKNTNSSFGDPPITSKTSSPRPPIKTPTRSAVIPPWEKTSTPKSKDDCVSTSSVTLDDEGKVLCVSGLVAKAYWGDPDRFFITFSNDASDFRFIVLGGYYYDVRQGNCVEATGKVKVYGGMPYIEVTDELWDCAPSR